MHSSLHDWFARADHERHRAGSSEWVPAVDVIETPSAFLVYAELPGLGPSDFSVEAGPAELSIRGRRFTREAECERYARLERREGEFVRSFAFPDPIEPGAITATLADGVLTLHVPKAGASGPRRIHIG